MSLIKQLWLGITIILLLALGGSFVISIFSAKHYLQEQLQLKNIDNATTLALSLSQLEKDPTTLELLISAQFDSGHYQRITLLNPEGDLLIERTAMSDPYGDLPRWFVRLAAIDVQPGMAQIQDGWQQYATIFLESHTRFALNALWEETIKLFQWFLLATLFSGLIGTWILKYISRPLDMVVQQAEAISERRFVTSTEPRTSEFQRLVRAMNALSGRVKTMLEKETQRLELLRRESQQDPLTGLFNRTHFLNLLDTELTHEEKETQGSIIIARVLNLAEMNSQLGRTETDRALRLIAATMAEFAQRHTHSYAARLNGSDFALAMTGHTATESLSNELSHMLRQQLAEQGLTLLALPLAACLYETGEKRSELLHKLDGALAQAALKGDHALIILSSDDPKLIHRNLGEWRDVISQALQDDNMELARFPVKSAVGELLHFEAPVRLRFDGDLQNAGYFVPWASRLGMMPSIDYKVVKRALQQLNSSTAPLAINMSSEALCDPLFGTQTLALLEEYSHQATDLWLEFPEAAALRHPQELRNLCRLLRNAGCKVGLEHIGAEFAKITELQELGLHYLKIDSPVIRAIDTNPGNQSFVQGLCKIGHSLGIMMIAEGVTTREEELTLIQLGLDGMTGPGIK